MKTRSHRAAFTLVEVMIAIGVLGIFAGASISVLLRLNDNAVLARLQTAASTQAQTRIDRILQAEAFPPTDALGWVTLGTKNEGSDNDPSVPIYKDPKTKQFVVGGWVTTTLTNTTLTPGGDHWEIYKATVNVSYRFRGKTYTVVADTLRAAERPKAAK